MKAKYQTPEATVLNIAPVEMLAASPTGITIVKPTDESDQGISAGDSFSNGQGWNSTDWADAE